MADTAYQKRLGWALRLCRDVMATLGEDAGRRWWNDHDAALKQNLGAVQRAWNVEKSQLRIVREGAGDGE